MKIKLRIILMTALLLTACQNRDLPGSPTINEQAWAAISTGQQKALVLQMMGSPDYSEQLSILGVEIERLTWQSHLPPRRYQLDFALGRVVAKQQDSKPLLANY